MEAAYARTETVQIFDYVPAATRTSPAPVVVLETARPAKPAPATDLPAAVMALSVVLYAIMFAALGWGFTNAPAIGFVLGVVIVALSLVPDVRGGVRDFMNGTMDTATGPVSGKTAIVLVLTVPTLLALATLAIGIAFRVLQ
ncbi:MAG: hypothetical protein IT535_00525 [Bauldia sp.]|nr:hypothetical protein [Bauldia sp.]